ncbi:MAG: GvpL/GvpF family gas vesicle protein [Solirubrobacterales bacterium]
MGGDEAIEELRRALDSFAAERVPGLIREAEEEALARARKVLGQEMLEALLRRSGEALAPAPGKVRADGAPPAPGDPSELGYYVYGIVEGEAVLPEDLVGVDGRHVPIPIREGDLTALASRVDLAEFGEEGLRENLEDVAWLEEKARAHEGVLDGVLARNTVVPMRLCTIYRGEDQVREMLRRERRGLAESLRHLHGRAEWGAKAIARPGALVRAAMERIGDGGEADGASSGVQYLERKRSQGRAREEAAAVAEELARAIHEPLAELAVEALLNPLQRPEVSGREGDMILNGVYLLDETDVERFRALAEELAERYREEGVEVELSGPWPPYNFVEGSIEAAR